MGLIANTNEEYHASEGVSKSFLWAMETQTPYLAKYGKREDKPQFALGTAAHVAILEPERLESLILRGPDDRRGNKWKEAQDFATYSGKTLLVSGDYDMALMIRDVAATVPELDMMREVDDDGNGPMVETSCYHVDEETGLTVRCRPDIYSPKHKLILDVKNMADASPEGWERDTGKFGYHVQDALYEDVWGNGSGYDVEGFWFLVFEKSEPPQVAMYEIDAAAAAEGHARYRRALKRTKECMDAGVWPSYPKGIQRSTIRRYDYRVNQPPETA